MNTIFLTIYITGAIVSLVRDLQVGLGEGKFTGLLDYLLCGIRTVFWFPFMVYNFAKAIFYFIHAGHK